jgi:hypothetical protein
MEKVEQILTITARLDTTAIVVLLVITMTLISIMVSVMAECVKPNESATDRVWFGFLLSFLWLLSVFGLMFVFILLL